MKNFLKPPLLSDTNRRGAAHILIATMLLGFIVTSALTIDFAYMQLIRTELRSATDAAAKAGAETGENQTADRSLYPYQCPQ
jgi:Flp pilus assembly protein TadG